MQHIIFTRRVLAYLLLYTSSELADRERHPEVSSTAAQACLRGSTGSSTAFTYLDTSGTLTTTAARPGPLFTPRCLPLHPPQSGRPDQHVPLPARATSGPHVPSTR